MLNDVLENPVEQKRHCKKQFKDEEAFRFAMLQTMPTMTANKTSHVFVLYDIMQIINNVCSCICVSEYLLLSGKWEDSLVCKETWNVSTATLHVKSMEQN